MNAKLAIKTVFAFALALLAGRYVFMQRAATAPVVEAVAVKSTQTQGGPITLPTAVDLSWVPQSKMVNAPINTDFKPVEKGMLNENGRMTTFVPVYYTESVKHSAPHHFNQSVETNPVSQEVRRGAETVGVVGVAKNSKAYLLNRDGQRHVVYPQTYVNTDDRLYMREDGGMEHDIILKYAPKLDSDCGLAFTNYLKLSSDLTMWDGDVQIKDKYSTRRGVHFKNSFGNTVFYLRPPLAYDAFVTNAEGGLDKNKQALPQNQRHLTGCEYQISFEEQGVKLAVVTPGSWLNSPERQYPVVIDPNFGPFGLADGNPPIYTGAVGSDTFIPLHNGANGQGSILIPTGNACVILGFPETEWGGIFMPFPFTFYGDPKPAGTVLYLHEVGFASWTPPDPNPFPLFPHAPCFDVPNQAVPDPNYPFDGFFPYWADLQYSSDPLSAIYALFDNTRGPGQGRVIMEWYRMRYFVGGTASDVISFNLILYECNSIAEFIIKNPGQNERDLGVATIGIENEDGTVGIQYCFNAAAAGQQEVPDSTAVTFSVSPLSNLNVTSSNLQGCKPLTSCYAATIIQTPPPCVIAGGGASIPASFGFHWSFGDGGEAFTPNVCHTFVTPGVYQVTLEITDSVGNVATFTAGLAATVCDIPPVVLTVDPQGGTAPLTVNVDAKSISPVMTINGIPNTSTISLDNSLTQIVVDELSPQNEPFQFTNYQTILGPNGTIVFDHPGTYRINASFSGTSFGLNTTGTGTVFINVLDPNAAVFNSLIITQSDFVINWAGKLPNLQGVPPAPASDTLTLKGMINLQGLELSALAGQLVTVALNAYAPIFESTLDANGRAVQGDFAVGRTGTFNIQPTGAFTCSVKGDLAFALGVTSLTERRLLTEHFRIQLGNVFNSPGTMVTYDYKSNANKRATGHYRFGKFANYGIIPGAPGGFGQPGGQEVLLSGGFVVTNASFKLEGDTVTATINGLLARAGGDDLRPAATSDVVVKIGNYTETLNFSQTPKFRTSGKAPAQKFSFKSGGGTNIKSLGWANKAGNFQIKTFAALPNAQVGINPNLGRQPITLQFIVSPENGQQYIGTTTFDIFKVSDTEFKH